MGYHLKSQVKHLCYCYKSETFHQLNLHHIVTIYLVLMTYVSGKMVWGIPIMIISYFTDLVINSYKFFREIKKCEKITIFLRYILVLSWSYNRVFIFLFEIINPAYYYYAITPTHVDSYLQKIIMFFTVQTLGLL